MSYYAHYKANTGNIEDDIDFSYVDFPCPPFVGMRLYDNGLYVIISAIYNFENNSWEIEYEKETSTPKSKDQQVKDLEELLESATKCIYTSDGGESFKLFQEKTQSYQQKYPKQ
jgi:hypothetical protein